MDTRERQDDVAALGTPWPLVTGVALVAVLGIVVAFLVGVALPFVVNDLHRLPLADVRSGRYDSGAPWPTGGGPFATLMVLGGALSLLSGLFVLPALTVYLGAALLLQQRDMDVAARRRATAALVLACAAWGAWFSPWGLAMTSWFLD